MTRRRFLKSTALVSACSLHFLGASVASDALQPDPAPGVRSAVLEAARLDSFVVLVTPDKHPFGGGEGIIVPRDDSLKA